MDTLITCELVTVNNLRNMLLLIVNILCPHQFADLKCN